MTPKHINQWGHWGEHQKGHRGMNWLNVSPACHQIRPQTTSLSDCRPQERVLRI